MSFFGPVTRLDGLLVRPHDLEVLVEPAEGTTKATVVRVARLGFEVRIEIKVGDTDVFVQVTRDTAERLGVEPGGEVHIRPLAGARTLEAGPDVPADEVEDTLELSTVP